MNFTIKARRVSGGSVEERVIVSTDFDPAEAQRWFERSIASFSSDWLIVLTGHESAHGTKEVE